MKYFGLIPLVTNMKSGRLMPSGNFVSSIKAKLWEDELKFNQDLNGDGDTGLVTVEAIGNAHLKHGDNTTMAPHNTTSLTAVTPTSFPAISA